MTADEAVSLKTKKIEDALIAVGGRITALESQVALGSALSPAVEAELDRVAALAEQMAKPSIP